MATKRNRVWIGIGVVLVTAAGVFLALAGLQDEPRALPADMPTYEFVGDNNICPVPELIRFEWKGRQYQTLMLHGDEYHTLTFFDLPQLVTADGKLPPTRRIFKYHCYVNPDGMRGKWTYSREDSPDRYRIGVIGTGVTFGEGVSDDELFTHLLEERLNAEPPVAQKFEVLNFGVPCMTTDFAVGAFLKRHEQFDLDLWIFVLGVNDALPMFHRSEDDYRESLINLLDTIDDTGVDALVLVEPMNTFYPWMNEYRRYRKVLEEVVSGRVELVDLASYLDQHERWNGLRLEPEGEVQRVVQYRRGRPRVLFEATYRAREGEQYISPEIYEYLDTHEVHMATFITDVHLNPHGHRVTADFLYHVLARRLRRDTAPRRGAFNTPGHRRTPGRRFAVEARTCSRHESTGPRETL